MIGNKEFIKICSLTKNFLRERPFLSNLGNPFLFVVSGHPFILSRYKFVDKKKIDFLYLIRFFQEILFNIIKIKLFFFKPIFSKNFENINKNFDKGYLIVSHLINIDNFKKGIDTQYNGIEKKIPKNKALFFYLDHINIPNKHLFMRSNVKNNFFIDNNCIKYSHYKKIIFNIMSEFSYLIKKANKNSNYFEKKFYLECAKYLFSLSTIKNIILFYNLEKLIIDKKIKYLLITLEGHPYEHLIFLLGKIHKIKVFAYQNTYITKSHFSMFLNLGKDFLPTQILASGKISYDFLKTKFKSKKVTLLGSKKYKETKKTKITSNSNCLVMPTGLENETVEFLELCNEYLKIEKNSLTKFIIRLHPLINKSKFIKKNHRLINNEERIKISNSKLKEDVLQCNFVLYRASSAVVEAMQLGLIPIFLFDLKNNFQSDALWQLKSKPVIKNSNDLKKVLNNKSYFNKKKTMEFKKFSNDFYRPINNKVLKKIFVN